MNPPNPGAGVLFFVGYAFSFMRPDTIFDSCYTMARQIHSRLAFESNLRPYLERWQREVSARSLCPVDCVFWAGASLH